MKRIYIVIACLSIILVLVIGLSCCFDGLQNSETNSNVNNSTTNSLNSKNNNSVYNNSKQSSSKKSTNESQTNPSNNLKSKYTVVFKDENGKTISKQTVKKGASAQEPKAPKKKGYYFYSWSRNVDKVTGDITVTPVFFKDGTVPQIEMDQVKAKAKEKNVALNIMVKNNPGISSISLDVIYDKDHLKLTNFTYNTEALKGSVTVPFNEKSDPACLSLVNSNENITGDFKLATLYFDVIDNSKAAYPIVLTCDDENVYNIDETNIHFEIVNGLISVK